MDGRILIEPLRRSRNKKLLPTALDLRLILLHLARGLAAMHRRGVAHMDIKTSNVLVYYGGGSGMCDQGGQWLPECADMTGLASADAHCRLRRLRLLLRAARSRCAASTSSAKKLKSVDMDVQAEEIQQLRSPEVVKAHHQAPDSELEHALSPLRPECAPVPGEHTTGLLGAGDYSIGHEMGTQLQTSGLNDHALLAPVLGEDEKRLSTIAEESHWDFPCMPQYKLGDLGLVAQRTK